MPKYFLFFVFISGGTCSGKSYMARLLKEIFGNDCTLLEMDNYFKNSGDISLPKLGGRVSFDLPKSYHRKEMKDDFRRLIKGNIISSPVYDIQKNERVGTQLVSLTKIVIIEGLYASMMSELIENPCQKLSIFISASSENMLKRRIKRDLELFGFAEERVLKMFYSLVNVPYERYVLRQQKIVDMIIENNYEGNN